MTLHAGVQQTWLRGETVERWIGFDADEPSRGERQVEKNPQPTLAVAKTFAADPLWRWRTPLIEWDMGREECVEAIARAGLPQPGKSSCFFCPSMKKHEIVELRRKHPDLLERALRIEDGAKPFRGGIKGLGRNFSWRSFLDGQPEAVAAQEIVDTSCACYDGDLE